MTYEQIIDNCKPSFRKKLQHTVELLRKAEKLALTYDSEDGFFLAFSGGKDSQALYHSAMLAGVKFKAHMIFTSVDPPQVIRFIRENYPDVVTHAPKWSIYERAVQRGILPSMRIRWCCADFKEAAGAGKVTLIGIRKSESVRRSKRHEVEVSDKRFSGDLEGFMQWREGEIKRKEEKLLRKMKREGKKVNEDYFSSNKENEVRCINGKDSILISPIFEWTEQDVWYFLNEMVKVPHCELYDKGYRRIGCILCPMSQQKQKIRELKDFPHVKRGWINAIKKIREGGVSQDKRTNCEWNRKEDTGIWASPPQEWEKIKHHRNGKTMAIGRTAMEFLGVEQESQYRDMVGFSDSPSLNGNRGGQNEPTEDDIAEKIFDWWISGKSYSKWYADKYLQLKLDLK